METSDTFVAEVKTGVVHLGGQWHACNIKTFRIRNVAHCQQARCYGKIVVHKRRGFHVLLLDYLIILHQANSRAEDVQPSHDSELYCHLVVLPNFPSYVSTSNTPL